MENGSTAIHQEVRQALGKGEVLTEREVRRLRDRSGGAILRYKVAFWVAIGIFNLILWVPMPLPKALLVSAAVVSILFAFIVPVIGIRNHNRRLDLLRDGFSPPKKRGMDETGRKYLGGVRAEGRSLVRAEVEVLEEHRDGTGQAKA